MTLNTEDTKKIKNIALIAHDNRKEDLVSWCKKHNENLRKYSLYATGTTGMHLEKALSLPVHRFLSGPLGGDFQIGSAIVDQKIDMLIFFWDPLETQGHDPDVKALLRLATMWNIPMACNEVSADFFMNSRLIEIPYQRKLGVIEKYNARRFTQS